MKLYALLAAVQSEIELIVPHLKKSKSGTLAGKRMVRGRYGDRELIVISGGIGAVNAAQAATALIERSSPDAVISTGTAGAYGGSGLRTGDTVLATAEIYGDWGAAGGSGLRSFRNIGIPLVSSAKGELYNEFPFDGPLMKKASKLVRGNVSESFAVLEGKSITVAASSGSTERAAELSGPHRAVCENMEGAAVAHVSAIYETDMIEIRGISNIAGVRDKRKWNIKKAAENCQSLIMHLLEEGL